MGLDEDRTNIFTYRENLAWQAQPKQLPVTIVTGSLGSGKTTPLKHILNNKQNLRVAAAVNDFSSVNIDHQLVSRESNANEVVGVSNGCVCCSSGTDDLVEAVWKLLVNSDAGKIDYVVVETSGVANPLRSIQVLEASYGKMYRVRLDCVATVVDTDVLYHQLMANAVLETSTTAQLLCADVVILNKIDIAPPSAVSLVREHVNSLVPGVRILECQFGKVSLCDVLGVGELSTNGSEGIVSHDQEHGVQYKIVTDLREQRSKRIHPVVQSSPNHTKTDGFDSVVFEEASGFSLAKWQDWLNLQIPSGLVRMKGTICFAEDNAKVAWSFHFSGRKRIECTQFPSVGERRIQLVLIGKGFDKAAIIESLRMCFPNTDEQLQRDIGLVQSERAEYVTMISQSRDLWEISQDSPEHLFAFRFSPGREMGRDENTLKLRFGIDTDQLNFLLIKYVNFSATGAFLTWQNIGNKLMLRFALGGNISMRSFWSVIEQQADLVINERMRSGAICDCGW